MSRNVHLILGAGGAARETYWVVRENDPGAEVVFLDDASENDTVEVDGCRFIVQREWRLPESGDNVRHAGFSAAIVEPAKKRVYVEKAIEAGLTPAKPLISPHALYRADSEVGAGSVVHARAYVSTHVRLGDFVTMLPTAGCAHDVVIGEYATCEALCTIAGYTRIGDGVHICAGAAVRQNLTIAEWVTVETQSCVTADIAEPGTTVSGAPARAVL